MGKLAFVFAGQGAQYPAMGRSLYEGSEGAKAVFDMAETLRPGTMAQCFQGTAEELRQTENTQPCIFTVDLAAAAALQERGIIPDAVAGFSLGEVAALSFAGFFPDFETGFSFVCKRGRAMAAAAKANPGGMVAVLRLDNETVEGICKECSAVYPVNYNAPGQLVVAGGAAELEAFGERIKEAGGRVMPLAVGGGFHSPFMARAAADVGAALAEIPDPIGERGSAQEPEQRGARIPVYANVTGSPYPADWKPLLARQTQSPVRWQETIEALWAAGFDRFVELGPGKTLSGLIKKTVKGARTFQVQEAAEVEAVANQLKAC